MSDVFVVRNQLGHFWGKGKRWVDGSDPKSVMRTAHQDEAINTLFELSSKDIELRGEVLPTSLSERGEPVVEASSIPVPGEDMEEPSENTIAATDETIETQTVQSEDPQPAPDTVESRHAETDTPDAVQHS